MEWNGPSSAAALIVSAIACGRMRSVLFIAITQGTDPSRSTRAAM